MEPGLYSDSSDGYSASCDCLDPSVSSFLVGFSLTNHYDSVFKTSSSCPLSSKKCDIAQMTARPRVTINWTDNPDTIVTGSVTLSIGTRLDR